MTGIVFIFFYDFDDVIQRNSMIRTSGEIEKSMKTQKNPL